MSARRRRRTTRNTDLLKMTPRGVAALALWEIARHAATVRALAMAAERAGIDLHRPRTTEHQP